MAKGTTGRGRTVEEAIANGLRQLQLSREQVDINVIQEPDTKWFGLVGSSAQVLLVPKPSPQASPHPEDSRARSGMLRVENGILEYEPPEVGGLPGVLILEPGIEADYAGERVTGRVELHDGLETLELHIPESQEPLTQLEAAVAEDSMSGTVLVTRSDGCHYVLREHAPTPRLMLRVDKQIVPAPTPTQSDAAQHLAALGVCHGVNLAALTSEVLSRPNASVVVARGTPPQDPIDGSVQYLFQRRSPVDLEVDRVDHYEAGAVVAVKEGIILAKRMPPKPGIPGCDVYGQTVAPREPRQEPLAAGEGATIIEEGTKIVAVNAGLPVVHGGVVKVLPVYELAGNADITTGNIHFQGEVIIWGNVLDQVQIDTQRGGIQVAGLVSHADLRAEGDIIVQKNIVSSKLSAGGLATIYLKTLHHIHGLSRQLSNLLKGFYTVQEQVQTPVGQLIKQLVEIKFADLPKKTQALQEYYRTAAAYLDDDLRDLVARLNDVFLGRGPLEIRDIAELERLLQSLEYWESIYKKGSDHTAHIKARYLQNSQLDASGCIEITGKGCYYSQITASQGFRGQQGVFRGGEIRVDRGSIAVKELGGPTGIDTKARIVHDGIITAQRVYPNVTLAVQNQHYRTDKELSAVKAVFVEGSLRVFSGSVQVNS